MSGGLAALLDDIAAMAKMAAASVDDVSAMAGKASVKAAGVVVDDTAVAPRYVTGFTPDRELPMIKRIAKGSIVNKAIILVAVLALSSFVPWILTPLLMLGGLYLSYEGAEKIWEKLSGHSKAEEAPAVAKGVDHEAAMVKGAIRTDFILSAEIMVISLSSLDQSASLWMKAASLAVVAVLITVGVYGVVALIVKMDDIGLKIAQGKSKGSQAFGNGLVRGMPKVLTVLTVVGTIAMLWVGGHILLKGLADLQQELGFGWSLPYDLVHHLEEWVHHATGPVGGFLGWLVNTFFSFLFGLIIGAIIVAIMHVLPFGKKHDEHEAEAAEGEAGAHGQGATEPGVEGGAEVVAETRPTDDPETDKKSP